MSKIRVYQLAKELNTTSKRLMEKLGEIDIAVKNHMSLLEENELEALYDHIGVIRHNKDNKQESDEKRNSSPVHQSSELVKEVRKEAKSGPRIIRTTEINLDLNNEGNDGRPDNYRNMRGNDKRSQSRKKNDIVKVASSTSGLRPGFVRETKPELKRKSDKDKDRESRNNQAKILDSKNVNIEETKLKEQEDNMIKTAADTAKTVLTVDTAKAEAKPVSNNKTNEKVAKEEHAKEATAKAEPAKAEPTKTESTKAGPAKADFAPKESFSSESSEKEPVKEAVKEVSKSDWANGESAKTRDSRNKSSQPNNNRPVNRNVQGKYDNRGTNSVENRQDNRQGQGNRQGNRQDSRQDNRQGNNSGRYGNNQGRQGNSQGRPVNNSGRPGGNRPSGDRSRDMNRSANRPLEIPKVDAAVVKKEEINVQRTESRREFVNKDVDKDSKREQKREIAKGTGKTRNEVPNKNMFGGKKEVSKILSDDFVLDEFYSDGVKKGKKPTRQRKDAKAPEKHIPPKAVLTSIKIPETITVKDLAESLKKTAAEVIKKLMGMGVMAVLNQELDFDTASIVSDEFGVKAEKELVVNEEDILFDDSEEEDETKLEPRPPVVVVMGHVDHGKTSLLDALKETNVIDSEAGGITQHIGAYMVKVNERNITFLDTPGHEAFTAMRARGAQVTDVAILVVAADDGVMPQTVEAINHAKAANVTIIVAINKIDKPAANPDRVKQELTEHGLVSEEWGGDTICVEVSAKKRMNIDNLLEMVLLAADMLELKANPNKQAKGTVIEAKLDKDKGPTATVLVQRGTLNVGDSIVTGSIVGRIRAMTDDKGHKIKKAGPSTPVEILGMPEVPEAGEIFYAVTDEKVAKQLVEKRRLKQREIHLKSSAKVSLDDLFNQIKEGKVKDLNIIVKADVQGSVEAVKQSLEKLSNEEVRVKIIHGGVGAVTETDVTLAEVSNAIIIGFNVRPSATVTDAAKNAGVDLRLYTIIYNAIEDIESAMKGLLEPTYKENVLGHIEIRQTFKVSGIGTIAGCYVTDGKVVRNSEIRLIRDGIVVHQGKLASLKRFKDDVKEVAQGYECGLSVEKYNDIKIGDIVEAYVMEEIER